MLHPELGLDLVRPDMSPPAPTRPAILSLVIRSWTLQSSRWVWQAKVLVAAAMAAAMVQEAVARDHQPLQQLALQPHLPAAAAQLQPAMRALLQLQLPCARRQGRAAGRSCGLALQHLCTSLLLLASLPVQPWQG